MGINPQKKTGEPAFQKTGEPVTAKER